MALEEFSSESPSLSSSSSSSSVPVPEFGWQLWLLCSAISISVFSLLLLLAYYYLAVDDAVDPIKRRALALRYQQLQGQGQGGSVVVHFPKKEDKFARFKRWARCLRKVPAPANPPIQVCHVEVDVQVAIDALVAASSPAFPSAQAPKPPMPAKPQDSTSTPPPPAGARLPGGFLGARCPEEVAAEEEGQQERLRRRILQFLLEAGPPKRLCAISESEHEGRSPLPSPALEPQSSPAAAVPTLNLGDSSAPMPSSGEALAVDTRGALQEHAQQQQPQQQQQHQQQQQPQQQHQQPQQQHQQQQQLQPQQQSGAFSHLTPLLDGEELLRVSLQSGGSSSSIPLTRELLWAAFARLSAAPQQEDLYHCVC